MAFPGGSPHPVETRCSQRFEAVKEVQIVEVVLSVLLGQSDILVDVGGAEVESVVKRLANLDQRGGISLPKAICERVKVCFDTCNLNGIKLSAALIKGSIQSLQLFSDGLVKPTRENLVKTIFHGN